LSKIFLRLTAADVVLSGGMGMGLLLGRVEGKPVANRSPADIAGASYRMERAYLAAVHVPNAEPSRRTKDNPGIRVVHWLALLALFGQEQ